MKNVMHERTSRLRIAAVPMVEGRIEQSDRRALAELSPLALLREYGDRVRMAEACQANPRCTAADRANYVQLALRVEREVLNRLGSLYKITRSRP